MHTAIQLMVAEAITLASEHLCLEECAKDVEKFKDLDDSIFFQVFI